MTKTIIMAVIYVLIISLISELLINILKNRLFKSLENTCTGKDTEKPFEMQNKG